MELTTTSPPGLPDRKIFVVDKPRSSPNGSFWAFRAFTETGDSSTDEVLVVNSALDAQTVIVEGTTLLADGSGESVIQLNGKYGLNDNGCYAVLADSSTAGDDVITKGCEGGPLNVIARRNDVIPNLGGPSYIGFAREPQLDNTGQVWFGFDTSEAFVNRSIFVATDNTDAMRVFQEGVTAFGDLFGGTRLLESVDIEFTSQARGGFQVSGDGLHTLLRGDFQDDFATDDFLAYDGSVVVQEGAVADAIFTMPTAANNPLGSYMAGDGTFFARGVNIDGVSWAMHDGNIIAKTGDVAVPSTGEVFGGLNLIAPGLNGDYAIGGVTDFADNQTIVYYDGVNDARAIARVGDAVDLDGDQQITLNDAVIQGFSNDGAVILPNNCMVAEVSLCKGDCASTPDFLGTALVQFGLEPDPVDEDPDVVVFKSDELIFDADGSGTPFARDLIEYTVAVINGGGELSESIDYIDVTDPNTILVAGTVSTSKGTVTTGNNRGDQRVEVRIDGLEAAESVSITYTVRVNQTIDNDLICNQGQIVGGGVGTLSDDPDTEAADDATCVSAAKGPPGNGGANGNPNPPEVFCVGMLATIVGTNGHDIILGTSNADVIHGLRGNDTIDGLGGDDVICGGRGEDEIDGGEGADKILGQAGDDLINGGTGDDILRGHAGEDQLFGEDGDDMLNGGRNEDGLAGGPDDDILTGRGGADDLEGDEGNDMLFGGTRGDYLDGGSGGDYMEGNFGDDDMYGHDGNDVLIGNAGDDFLDGENDIDSLRGRHGDDVMVGGLGDDFLKGGFGNDDMDGGPDTGDDPGVDRDRMRGGPGNDDMRGGFGDDKISGDQGDDNIDGGDGNDECNGGLGDLDVATACETVIGVP
jgi:Ca2+-binding RTX toxin-like protein